MGRQSRAELIAILLLLLFAAPAQADDDDSGGSGGGCGTPCLIGLGVVVGGVDLGFTLVNIVKMTRGTFHPPGWAIFELLWGGGHVLTGVILAAIGGIGLAIKPEAGGGAVLGSGLLILAMGTWLVVHAIVSLVKYVSGERRVSVPRGPLVPVVSVGVDRQGDATALLTWQF